MTRPEWMRGKVTTWLTTVDHKRVGILYVGTSLVFLFLGGLLALLLRMQLSTPTETFLGKTSYAQVVTVHGTTMLFLVVAPILAGLGSYLAPLLIGARDVAFPRLNALGYWLFLLGGVVLYSSFLAKGGPAGTGWTGSVPLAEQAAAPGNGVNLLLLALCLLTLSTLCAAITIVVTVVNMRAEGMSWMRMPPFVWSLLVFAVLLLVVLPSFAVGLTMLLLDREGGTHFFIASQGGSTVLYRHAFWFLAHPELYLLILPPLGIVSEVLPVFSRKPIAHYRAVVCSTVALGALFALFWALRTFVFGLTEFVHYASIGLSLAIAAAACVLVFAWLATLWRGELRFDSPLQFALGFLFLFAFGGLSGIALALFSHQWQETYHVVAQLHYALYGSSLFAILAGLHYWWPKLHGRLLDERLARATFWLLFVGFNVTFFVQFLLGHLGMERRADGYGKSGAWETYNLISTVGSWIIAAGLIVFLTNILRTQRSGRRAGNDPWHGDTLEWYTTSPPPEHNFDTVPAVDSARPLSDLRQRLTEPHAR